MESNLHNYKVHTSERLGTSAATDTSTSTHHFKRIHYLTLLCNLLFCTDDRCSMALHTLITAVVESQGGSSHLMKIMIPLGLCASFDILHRYIVEEETYLQRNDDKDIYRQND